MRVEVNNFDLCSCRPVKLSEAGCFPPPSPDEVPLPLYQAVLLAGCPRERRLDPVSTLWWRYRWLLSLASRSAALGSCVHERLRVRILAAAAGEFSSPELTLCAYSYSVSVPPPCYRSGTEKAPVILPKVQLAGYICASFCNGQRREAVTLLTHVCWPTSR